MRYDEYGRIQNTNPYWQSRFAFTGQRYFGGFGLYHYKNRMYDPRVGRFMQPDPIGYGSGMNLYAYVGGDPVNLTDPRGQGCLRLWLNHGMLDLNTGDVDWTDSTWLGDWCSSDFGPAGPSAGGGGRNLEDAPAPNELACLTPLECARDLKESLLALQKKPKPPFTGTRAQAFAKAAGFQQGPKLSVGALRQLNAQQTMQNIIEAKFTRQDVYDWALFYSITYERDRSNLTAFVRTEQLREVLRVWPGK